MCSMQAQPLPFPLQFSIHFTLSVVQLFCWFIFYLYRLIFVSLKIATISCCETITWTIHEIIFWQDFYLPHNHTTQVRGVLNVLVFFSVYMYICICTFEHGNVFFVVLVRKKPKLPSKRHYQIIVFFFVLICSLFHNSYLHLMPFSHKHKALIVLVYLLHIMNRA